MGKRFQSTPVIANGRIQRRRRIRSFALWFQSTPVIANGRIDWSLSGLAPDAWFQSTPVIANGRIPSPPVTSATPIAVSIHARYC